MRNLFRLMKIPSSLKPTSGVLTRSRVSSARHLPGDNIPGRYRVPHFGSQNLHCRTAPEVESAARENFDTIETLKKSNDTIHAGFDVEWNPTLRRGKSPGKAAVIHICFDLGGYVMHIFHSGITPGLRELLENSVFTKVGVSIRSDACKVLRDQGVKVHDLMDLSGLANLKFGGKAISWCLRSLTEKLFSIQLKKCNLVELGNWEAIELSRSQLEHAAANAVASCGIYQVLKSLPDATKGDELEKKNLKTDATKGDELDIFFLKTDATKDDELKKKILKTVTTKGDELKKKVLKMPLMALLACKSWMAWISDIFINSHKIKNQIMISTADPEIIIMKVVEDINSRDIAVHLYEYFGGHTSCFRLFWTKVDCNLRFRPSSIDTTIVPSNGVYLIGRTAQCLLVCDPLRGKLVTLPPTTDIPDAVHVLSGVGIGLDRSTYKYKVVRIFLRDKGYGGIEVITVDRWNYNPWRRLKTYPPYMMTMNLTVVTVQGAAYWIICKIKNNERINYIDDRNLEIQRLDLSSEEFSVIDSPDPNQVIHLAEMQGQLCCYAEGLDQTLQSTIWVWLYNESDNIATDHWTLRYTIHHLFTPTLGHHASFKPIAIDKDGCLLFDCLQRMHLYDPRSYQFYKFINDAFYHHLENKSWYCHITSVNALVPI